MPDTPQWPTFREVYESVKEIVLGYPTLSIAQRIITWFFFATFITIFMLVVLPRLDCATGIPNACNWIGTTLYDYRG